MSAALPKVLSLKKGAVLKRALVLSSLATPRENLLCAAAQGRFLRVSFHPGERRRNKTTLIWLPAHEHSVSEGTDGTFHHHPLILTHGFFFFNYYLRWWSPHPWGYLKGNGLLSCQRHYKSRPTHGIGRYKYLLPKEGPKKRRDKVQMKEINVGTDHEYGDLNIQMTSYDMCLVEQFASYVHKLCNSLSIRVIESYAMPTKTNEVLYLEEKGSKMQLDAVLTTHQRVVQITGLSSTFAPILLEIIQSNQPEGVHLLIKEHTEADFKSRLKSRPELEELLAQMS